MRSWQKPLLPSSAAMCSMSAPDEYVPWTKTIGRCDVSQSAALTTTGQAAAGAGPVGAAGAPASAALCPLELEQPPDASNATEKNARTRQASTWRHRMGAEAYSRELAAVQSLHGTRMCISSQGQCHFAPPARERR